jgi:hypothetical protein
MTALNPVIRQLYISTGAALNGEELKMSHIRPEVRDGPI